MQIKPSVGSETNYKEGEKSYLEKYFEIKKQISLPVKLKIYFSIF